MSYLTPSAISRSSNLRLLSSLLPPATAIQRSQAHLNPARRSNRHTSSFKRDPQSAQECSTSTSPFQSPPSQSSVSPSEISHFSRLASSWWDPNGPSRLLHLMNPLRHTFIASCLSSVTSPSPTPHNKLTYLDIGCGGGIFAESAARLPHTHSVTAIDPTPSVLSVAKSHQRTDPTLQPPKLTYLNAAIEDLSVPPSDDEKADILTLFEVLEHIDTPSSFLASCIPHLKPCGWIIGSTIARSPLSFLTTKIIAEAPIIGVVPRGTHDWNKYINPAELGGWFEKRSRSRSGEERWGTLRTQGVVYIPGLGWRMVDGVEGLGNYFFGVQRFGY